MTTGHIRPVIRSRPHAWRGVGASGTHEPQPATGCCATARTLSECTRCVSHPSNNGQESAYIIEGRVIEVPHARLRRYADGVV